MINELAKEIRLGNYFTRHSEGGVEVALTRGMISSIMGCEEDGNYWGIFEACYSPIKLTEDWLLRMGFHQEPNKSYINNTKWTFQIGEERMPNGEINRDGTWFDGLGTITFEDDGVMAVNTLCRGNYVCRGVDTVHELQNLFFSITGEELKIKEDVGKNS